MRIYIRARPNIDATFGDLEQLKRMIRLHGHEPCEALPCDVLVAFYGGENIELQRDLQKAMRQDPQALVMLFASQEASVPCDLQNFSHPRFDFHRYNSFRSDVPKFLRAKISSLRLVA